MFPFEPYFALDFFVAVFFGFFLSFFLSLFPIINLLPVSVDLISALQAIRVGRRGIRTPDLLGVNQTL